MKIRPHLLLIAGLMALFIGALLWWVVGPIVIDAGIAEFYRRSHEWSFFEAYSWLSDPSPPFVDFPSTFWVGVLLTWVGLFVFVAGVVAVIVALVLAKAQAQVRK